MLAALPDDPPWLDPFVREVEQMRVGLPARFGQVDFLLREQGIAINRESGDIEMRNGVLLGGSMNGKSQRGTYRARQQA